MKQSSRGTLKTPLLSTNDSSLCDQSAKEIEVALHRKIIFFSNVQRKIYYLK